MESGKLDEALKRMSSIVDQISPDALVLFNESFSSTNEREGSQVAQMTTDALLEREMKATAAASTTPYTCSPNAY